MARKNSLSELATLGQSVWLDYIRRDLLCSAEFARLLDEDGLRGMTSNPTIFEKAIAGSGDYDQQLHDLVLSGKPTAGIYEALTQADIRMAADALRPLYDATEGGDGYVSYEVSPLLSRDARGTVAEAQRFFAAIDRPNLMIKVPGTAEGTPAIEELITQGRNINVTLMFSMRHYDAVAEAYIRGLERRVAAGRPVDRIASVASVFVSRIDTLVDRRLDDLGKASADERIAALHGKAAVANAKLIYGRFREAFGGERFKQLAAKGAHPQRPLWASTGTKNPAYSDIMYVEQLIGAETVNTMPPATMNAFRDHGHARPTIEEGIDEARRVVHEFARLGIDLDDAGETLQKEGELAFAKSFDDLLRIIEKRRSELLAAKGVHPEQQG
jgi:transaldolase